MGTKEESLYGVFSQIPIKNIARIYTPKLNTRSFLLGNL